MLKDEKLFEALENFLRKRGTIAEFEQENGKITGRMMITETEIPEYLEFDFDKTRTVRAFEGSFDFYDATVSVAVYIDQDSLEVASGLWVTPQHEDAEAPDQVWSEFFIETLWNYLFDGKSYCVPIYTFVNDTSSFTVTPTLPSETES